jgi:hypothetical protein
VREAEVERLDPEALARWRDAVAEGPLTTW